jgi:hypothetical protein
MSVDSMRRGFSRISLLVSAQNAVFIEARLTAAAEYHIDVRDTARLHVAPLLDPEIRGERLFAMNEVYDWEKVLKILHELRPEWKNDEVFKETRVNMSVVELRPRTEEILRKNFGQEGLTSMRDSIEANLAHLP